ncbi:glycosyltransferase family 4 protein [Nocardioides daeguensis]|uniref:Glycosyltransferase family 4 protein n=1 Tax=Nocardioides daeguensis TaxID=908359 RepID=A0ABP6UV95_9ACTN|nr:glycosyltransferase family 4 protein [Nocardioides daeguensis]MBV6725626.1 glycosyltransferase family 4 protein [Nocardioides daeguensis]MCR1772859.1 glycosyltransferase family 4 protein [Nocardioides daeguensis]
MRSLEGKRVVVVNWRDLDHTLAGGAEIYAWQFARALREAGAQVHFVTARDEGQVAREVRDGIDVRRGGGALTFYLFALTWLLRHRRRIDAVIDPACGLPSFSPLVLRRGTPALLIVHHVHQAQFAVHFPAPVAAFGRWMERVAMRRVYRHHVTAAVSASTVAEMREQLGWTGDIRILENGADLPPREFVDGVTKDPDRVVVLGRLVTHKRVDLALEAVRIAQDRAELAGRRIRVDVIGRGPEADRLVARAAELGLADQVTFHGFLPGADKDALLARAAVHVCASDAEGWGQAVVDAAAHGVPTVARDVPGLRDSIRPGESGWLVPDSADSATVVGRLAEALTGALVDAADAQSRALRAEVCVAWAHKFDWSQMRLQATDLTIQLLGHASTLPDRHHPRDARVAV